MEQSESNVATRSQLLVNWSKWLITINFSAATGCVVVLKISNENTVNRVGPYLFIAVLFFLLSVVVSTFFVLLMALRKDNTDETGNFQYSWLAKLQWMLFMAGFVFLIIWIAFLSKLL